MDLAARSRLGVSEGKSGLSPFSLPSTNKKQSSQNRKAKLKTYFSLFAILFFSIRCLMYSGRYDDTEKVIESPQGTASHQASL
jgi:hypothetical protein